MCKRRDLNLVVDSLETLVAGLVLAVNRKMLQDYPHDHVVHFMHAFGNMNRAVLSCFVFIRILLQSLDFPGHGRRSE